MKPESIQTPLNAFPAWRYRQTDELRRRFALDSYQKALNFVVAMIELAEELGQEPTFTLAGRQVSLHVSVPDEGVSETVEAFIQGLETLWSKR